MQGRAIEVHRPGLLRTGFPPELVDACFRARISLERSEEPVQERGEPRRSDDAKGIRQHLVAAFDRHRLTHRWSAAGDAPNRARSSGPLGAGQLQLQEVQGLVLQEQACAPESKSWLLKPWLRQRAAQSRSLLGTSGGAPFAAQLHWLPPGLTTGR